ncbi:MAG: ABC transporter substrate-binding protein [Bacteroidales bacterium]|nr:ABC transporter substrate-binding protein [Bacteroidales bacterium]
MILRLLAISIVVSAITFLSCGKEKALPQDVFRYNESKGISTLDPAFAKSQTIIWPVSQIFNGLVQMNEKTQLVPALAKSWEILDDGKTYIFHLRQNVRFHDHPLFEGRIRYLNAKDVQYSLLRLSEPQTASSGAWVMNEVDRDTLSQGFSTPNDSTFIVRLKRSFPGFLGVLSMPYCYIVAPEIVEHYGNDFRSHPVGTGPFYLKAWREGEKLVLRKNPHYFEKDSLGKRLPYIEGLAITFINDKQSEYLEFIKGRLDFISGIHHSYKDELLTNTGALRQKYHDEIILKKAPYLNTEYLGFLTDSSLSPTANKYLRKAINWGFDREKMLKYLRNGIGQPAEQGIIPVGLPSFDAKQTAYTYQIDSAKYYLNLAGYPNGINLPSIILTTTSDYVDLCEYIQHELKNIGIDIKIEISSGATFRDQVASSKLIFFRGSWIADYPDAENYLSLFYSPNFSPSGPNYTHFKNKVFDNLYEEALKCTEDSVRWDIYKSMNQIVIDEAPIVPLYYDQVVRFYHRNVRNFEANAMNMLLLKRVIKD